MIGQKLEQPNAFKPRLTRKHRETTSRQEPNILSLLEPRALEKKSMRKRVSELVPIVFASFLHTHIGQASGHPRQ